MIYVAIGLGVLMAVIHYYSETICLNCEPFLNKLLSLSAGVSLTYIFLHLFPLFSAATMQIHRALFLTVLLGFVIFHIVEKYIYQHTPSDKLMRELAIEDSIVSFIYHFVVGVILVNFLRLDTYAGVLFFIPALLYTGVSTLPVDITQHKGIKLFLALSTMSGIVFALFIFIDPALFYALVGFIIGALLFTVTRHSIPKNRNGDISSFILGVIIYTILIYTL